MSSSSVSRGPRRVRVRRPQVPTSPAFLIIGAQKCGTTSLHDALSRHPRLQAGRTKELHFFDDSDRHARGLGWYRRELAVPLTLPRRLSFESTPSYLFHPDAPGRIARDLPGVPLIALLRDPVDRAVSGYRHEVRQGREHRSFAEAVEAEQERTRAALAAADWDSPALRHQAYLRRGHYAEQLERYLAVMPAERMLVLRSEDLFSDAAGMLQEVTDYLGLEPLPATVTFDRLNASGQQNPEIPTDVAQMLRSYYVPHNRRLESLTGRSFGWD